MTHKRVVVVVILVWVLSVTVPCLSLGNLHDTHRLTLLIGGVICLLLTTAFYIRIYFVARRHKNHIQTLLLQQGEHTGEISKFVSLINSAVGIFYVYLVFLVCYLSYFICLATIRMNETGISLKRFFLFCLTLHYLNSSLNPVIYCWKMRHIRHAIMNILRNMSWNRNRASH